MIITIKNNVALNWVKTFITMKKLTYHHHHNLRKDLGFRHWKTNTKIKNKTIFTLWTWVHSPLPVTFLWNNNSKVLFNTTAKLISTFWWLKSKFMINRRVRCWPPVANIETTSHVIFACLKHRNALSWMKVLLSTHRFQNQFCLFLKVHMCFPHKQRVTWSCHASFFLLCCCSGVRLWVSI